MNKIRNLPTVKQWKRMIEDYEKQKGETKKECGKDNQVAKK